MQHINDDIDDLLRNAAEDYPLKISGANWDTIAGRLASGEGKDEIAPVIAMQTSKARFYKYAALLLLIPLAYMAARYAGSVGNTKPSSAQVGTGIAKGGSDVQTGTKITTAPGKKNTQAAPVNADTVLASKMVAVATTNVGQSQTVFRIKAHGKGVIDSSAAYNGQNPVHNNSLALGLNKDGAGNKLGDKISSEQVAENLNPQSSSTEKIVGTEPDMLSGHLPKNSGDAAANAVSASATSPTMHIAKPKRFYIGAYVAPEYTTVKYQPGSKIGFTFGGLFGYKVSKFISLEAGIAVGKKYYTSDGKYFNSNVAWVHEWDKVLSISGYATLTEFPVTIRYNFKPTKEGNFFVATGLVSYVVHQENYNYLVDKNSTVYSITKTPIVSTTNFLSDVSISGGYQSSLGNLCNFRIEPYYRLPLKGIGIGSLPITSIGLNIGVTKNIK